jgi:hypothetical protein
VSFSDNATIIQGVVEASAKCQQTLLERSLRVD